jgi:hypothetical protein
MERRLPGTGRGSAAGRQGLSFHAWFAENVSPGHQGEKSKQRVEECAADTTPILVHSIQKVKGTMSVPIIRRRKNMARMVVSEHEVRRSRYIWGIISAAVR